MHWISTLCAHVLRREEGKREGGGGRVEEVGWRREGKREGEGGRRGRDGEGEGEKGRWKRGKGGWSYRREVDGIEMKENETRKERGVREVGMQSCHINH